MTDLPILDAIYEAVLRPEGWKSVVRDVAQLLDARDACFATYNFETKASAVDCLPIDPNFSQLYEEHWAHRNFLWEATHSLPVGRLFSFETAMPRAQFEKTEFFNEWWLPQGMTKALGVNLVATNALSSVATFFRPSNRQDFDRQTAQRFSGLVPHLARGMEIRHQLESLEGIAEDFCASLGGLGKPALLVDADCQLQFANDSAAGILRRGDLTLRPNCPLAARRPDQTRSLHRLVWDVLRNGAAGGRIGLQRLCERPLTLSVYRLHVSASPFARQSALILIDDPNTEFSSDGSASLLRTVYRLTMSEAQLALLIANGMRLRDAAEERKIGLATAKTHLAHIFQKTGVTSQGELIRLLIASGILSASNPLA